ncbi:MAG: hypothetical protein ABIP29_05490 [Candidatus Eisenbacteria bacterium]
MADLGFRWPAIRRGEVRVRREGRLVTTLRGRAAEKFLAEVARADAEAVQQLCARITGNYGRGNERDARNHPRNRHG